MLGYRQAGSTKVWFVIVILNYIDTSISKLICCNTAIKCSTSCQSFLVNVKANESELIYFWWIVLPANMFISYLWWTSVNLFYTLLLLLDLLFIAKRWVRYIFFRCFFFLVTMGQCESLSVPGKRKIWFRYLSR